ncbi:MAG: PadR family transcriptional regulator [Microthrixaceae bacterium]|nr:PadR family transcriptional regulator [Microthrixaceae bacterium]
MASRADSDARGPHLQELRRGTVVLACLAALRSPRYGYRLIEDLAAVGIVVGGDTLYPLLRRLESQGLLTSEWNTDEARPRKFYVTTPEGIAMFEVLLAEWRNLDRSIDAVVANTSTHDDPHDDGPHDDGPDRNPEASDL